MIATAIPAQFPPYGGFTAIVVRILIHVLGHPDNPHGMPDTKEQGGVPPSGGGKSWAFLPLGLTAAYSLLRSTGSAKDGGHTMVDPVSLPDAIRR